MATPTFTPIRWIPDDTQALTAPTGPISPANVYDVFLTYLGFYQFVTPPLNGPCNQLIRQTQERITEYMRLASDLAGTDTTTTNPVAALNDLVPYMVGAARYAERAFENILKAYRDARENALRLEGELSALGLGKWSKDLPRPRIGDEPPAVTARFLVTDALVVLDSLFSCAESITASSSYCPRLSPRPHHLQQTHRLPYTRPYEEVWPEKKKHPNKYPSAMARKLADFRTQEGKANIFKAAPPPAETEFQRLLTHKINTQCDVFEALTSSTFPLAKGFPVLIGIGMLGKKLALLREAERVPDSFEVRTLAVYVLTATHHTFAIGRLGQITRVRGVPTPEIHRVYLLRPLRRHHGSRLARQPGESCLHCSHKRGLSSVSCSSIPANL